MRAPRQRGRQRKDSPWSGSESEDVDGWAGWRYVGEGRAPRAKGPAKKRLSLEVDPEREETKGGGFVADLCMYIGGWRHKGRKRKDSPWTWSADREDKGNCNPMYIGVWLGGSKSASRPGPHTPNKTEKAGEATKGGLEGTSLLAGQRTGSGTTTIKLVSTTRWRNGREEGGREGQRRSAHQVDAHN